MIDHMVLISRSMMALQVTGVVAATIAAIFINIVVVVSGTISTYLNDDNVYSVQNNNNDTAFYVSRQGGGSDSELVLAGSFLGDPCSDHCSDNLTHAVCNETTGKCECELAHPIPLDSLKCIAALHLGEICLHEESCLFYEPNAECWQESPYYSRCACKSEYMAVENTGSGHSSGRRQKCVPDPYTLIQYDMSAVLGIGVGLSLFTGVTCLVLKLFSRARFGNPGGHYADANQSPPMLMTPVSGPPSRRSSGRSTGSGNRRPSYYSTLAPPSKPGSRRGSIVSVKSQGSIRSYGGRNSNSGTGNVHHHHHYHHHHQDHHHYPKQHQPHGHHHDSLRATVSAPIACVEYGNDIELGSPSGSSISSVRMLEQRFAQHASYHPARREDRETSRHSSQEIITEVISESPEKAFN